MKVNKLSVSLGIISGRINRNNILEKELYIMGYYDEYSWLSVKLKAEKYIYNMLYGLIRDIRPKPPEPPKKRYLKDSLGCR